MGKMGYIHYLCEKDDRDGLIEELGSIEMADGFLRAHKEIRLKQDSQAFGKLNEMVDKSVKEVEQDIDKAKEDSKNVKTDLDMLFKDIERMN
tara:strand:- start:286 stop:561 length:276 start_codon:yes stop_codon:yes gene_type:complete